MIQVLKHGNCYTQRKFTCENCRCIFLLSLDDNMHLRDPGITCPECGDRISVLEGNTIPEEDYLADDTPDPCNTLI